MSRLPLPEFADLTLQQQEALHTACDDFEQAWKQNDTPSIIAHLAQLRPELRPVALRELIILDLQYRWRTGPTADDADRIGSSDADVLPRRPLLEDYVALFQSASLELEITSDLVGEEFRVRQRWGDRPSPHDYRRRFPHLTDLDGLLSADSKQRTANLAKGLTRPAELQVRCPHCRTSLPLNVDAELVNLTCEACGERFSLAADSERASGKITTIGSFDLRERLGMGAFGSVWRAYDTELDREVAVKIPRKGTLNRGEVEQFMREARTAAQLRHPHIVAVHEIGRDGDLIFIVSDLVHGRSLTEWSAAREPTAREAAEMCATIAAALEHAHAAGVVHRDLKPHNIIVDDQDVPHIMDFGLARREVGEVTMTLDGQVIGTPAYMSPEQARGESHQVDRRADIYSLGVILFELLTGELPFRGSSRMMIYQVLHDEPPSPRKLRIGVPLDLETICLRCLEKEPAQRYASAQEVAAELRRFCGGVPIESRPISRLQKSWRWCQRRPVLASMVALLILLLCGITVISTTAAVIIGRQRQAALDMAAQREELRVKERDARQEAESQAAEAEEARREAEAITDYLVSAFRSPDPTQDGRHVTVVQTLKRAAEQLDVQEPGVRMRLLEAIGQSYLGLGQTDEAIELLSEALEIARNTFAADDPRTRKVTNHLARAFLQDGQFDEAESILQHQLALNTTDDAAIQLRTADLLGDTYLKQGRIEEAITLHEQTLATSRDELGEADPITLSSMHNLASAYQQAGRYAEAATLFEETLRQHRQVVGADHPDTQAAMNDLALAYEQVGRLVDARRLLEESLALSRDRLGERHPETLLTARNLAGFLMSLGQVESAIPLLEQTRTISTAKLGADHPDTLNAAHDLAVAFRDAGRLEEAITILEETLARGREKLGADHPDVLKTMSNLGLAYGRAGRYEEAHQLIVECLPLTRKVFGDQHPHVITLLGHRIRFHVEQQQFEAALPLVTDALRISHARFGEDHPRSLQVAKSLAGIYLRMGRHQEGTQLLEDLLPTMKSQLGAEHVGTLQTQFALGEAYLDSGRREAGEALLRTTLELSERVLGEEHPLTVKVRTRLAE